VVGVYVLLTVRTSDEVVDFVENADHEEVRVLILDGRMVIDPDGHAVDVLDNRDVLEVVIETGIVFDSIKEPVPVIDTVDVFDCVRVFVLVIDTDELFEIDTDGDIVILFIGVFEEAGLKEYENVIVLYILSVVFTVDVFDMNFENDCVFEAVFVFE
jgi:hypothetical protein